MKEKQVFLSKNSPFLYLAIINKNAPTCECQVGAFFYYVRYRNYFLLFSFSSSSSVQSGLSSSQSSKPKKASSANSFISRPSFLVGRPIPFCRRTKPPMRAISSNLYWSSGVMFFR